MKLTIATCQFPTSADLVKNLRYMLRLMQLAAKQGAHVAHFSETALSGYAGLEFATFENYDWDLLRECSLRLAAEAKRLKLWTVFGSSHRLSADHKPHNSLFVVDSGGKIVDRYDKMFCTGPADGMGGDLRHYSPGDHLSVFRIRGIPCGVLICHDFRYPEVYREYYKRGVRVMFHAYHNGHRNDPQPDNIFQVIVPPTMQASAATNAMWISATNTAAKWSCWPSFFVNPDGRITGRLTNNRTGLRIDTIDTKAHFYDASREWRDRCIEGVHHSGHLVGHDPRSADRQSF